MAFLRAVSLVDADDFVVQHGEMRGTADAEYDPGAFLVPALKAGLGRVDVNGVMTQ